MQQHSLKLHAGLHNNLLYSVFTEQIYSISDDLSYFGGTIRIITTQREDLYQTKAFPVNINIHNLLNGGRNKRFPILVS